MYPYLRFAAYLIYKQSDLAKYISPLPMPDIREIGFHYPNIPLGNSKGYRKWLKVNRMNELLKKRDDAVIAYKLWRTPRVRRFLEVAILRNMPDTLDLMKNVMRLPITKDVFDFYRFMFFDISGMNLAHLESYASKLDGEDYRIFNLALRDVGTELVLKEMGIQPPVVNTEKMLESLLMEAHKSFMGTKDPKWAKLFLSTIRTIDSRTDDNLEDMESVLAELKMEMKSFTSSSDAHIGEDGQPVFNDHPPPPPD